ncbi:hypothetical protein L484_005936 [Morus notabilis]|uniref:Polygalacturonase n=1 Tax=Morus notabilis TaxID=981085 RepID=W9R0H1_9ROSA|nr:hypothetical protein L484_005936 [Morus notabilis]
MNKASGSANNIKFLNIELNNADNPIIIDQHYCDVKKPCKEQTLIYDNIVENTRLKAEASCKNVELTDIGVVSPPCPHAQEGRENDTTPPPPVQPPVHDVEQPPPHDTAPPHVQQPGQGRNDTAPPPVQQPGQEKNDTAPPHVQQPGQGRNDTAPPPVQQPGQEKNDTAPPPVQQLGHATRPPVQRSRDHNNHHRGRHHNHRSHHHIRHHNNHKGGGPTRPPPVQRPVHDGNHKGGKNDTAPSVQQQETIIITKGGLRFNNQCLVLMTLELKGMAKMTQRMLCLLFDSIDNLVVEGGGTLNGNGDVWWKQSCRKHRSLMHGKCKLPSSTSNLHVTAPEDSPNTDGIHVKHTQDIQIDNCVIGTVLEAWDMEIRKPMFQT